MLPGPDYIYKCPHCGNLIARGSLMSGNTFGSKLYSDGKRISPMLPEFPLITKCRKCDTIFWLNKLPKVGSRRWSDESHPEWEDADMAEFLSLDDYFRAIEAGLAGKHDEELHIRQQIWWSFNDMYRHDSNLPEEVPDARYSENCTSLMKLFDSRNITQRIMMADLNRNMGNFDECLRLLSNIKGRQFDWLKEVFRKECEKGNRIVFEIKESKVQV